MPQNIFDCLVCDTAPNVLYTTGSGILKTIDGREVESLDISVSEVNTIASPRVDEDFHIVFTPNNNVESLPSELHTATAITYNPGTTNVGIEGQLAIEGIDNVSQSIADAATGVVDTGSFFILDQNNTASGDNLFTGMSTFGGMIAANNRVFFNESDVGATFTVNGGMVNQLNTQDSNHTTHFNINGLVAAQFTANAGELPVQFLNFPVDVECGLEVGGNVNFGASNSFSGENNFIVGDNNTIATGINDAHLLANNSLITANEVISIGLSNT